MILNKAGFNVFIGAVLLVYTSLSFGKDSNFEICNAGDMPLSLVIIDGDGDEYTTYVPIGRGNRCSGQFSTLPITLGFAVHDRITGAVYNPTPIFEGIESDIGVLCLDSKTIFNETRSKQFTLSTQFKGGDRCTEGEIPILSSFTVETLRYNTNLSLNVEINRRSLLNSPKNKIVSAEHKFEPGRKVDNSIFSIGETTIARESDGFTFISGGSKKNIDDVVRVFKKMARNHQGMLGELGALASKFDKTHEYSSSDIKSALHGEIMRFSDDNKGHYCAGLNKITGEFEVHQYQRRLFGEFNRLVRNHDLRSVNYTASTDTWIREFQDLMKDYRGSCFWFNNIDISKASKNNGKKVFEYVFHEFRIKHFHELEELEKVQFNSQFN